MDVLNNEFLLFLNCAQAKGLRYMLIGGYAVNYYGYVRNTSDMDVWIAPTNHKLLLIDTLLCMHYTASETSAIVNEDFTKPWVGTIGSGAGCIDILTVVHHLLDYDIAEKEKETFEVQPGSFINFVRFRFLREMKLKSARPKDF